ncbi:hypothetical protein [Cupriavidus sp. CuC1]|uniref:hypothetical protein n=1 Tax=Cupriavidus sp. CuC1 TaxID=3373131 RepID=UPI0037CE63E6
MDLNNTQLGDCQPLDSLQTASLRICLTSDPRITHLEDAQITGAVVVYGHKSGLGKWHARSPTQPLRSFDCNRSLTQAIRQWSTIRQC